MPLRTVPEAIVYQDQGDKEEICQNIVIKKREFW